jgi:hypothetical protein
MAPSASRPRGSAASGHKVWTLELADVVGLLLVAGPDRVELRPPKNNYFLVFMYRRDFIHRLVGRPCRLDLAVWIVRFADDRYFTQRDAVLGVQDNQSEVRANLEAMVSVGLLERTSNGRPHYRAVNSPVWPALVQLADAIASMADGRAEPTLEKDPPRGLTKEREKPSGLSTLPRRSSARPVGARPSYRTRPQGGT